LRNTILNMRSGRKVGNSGEMVSGLQTVIQIPTKI